MISSLKRLFAKPPKKVKYRNCITGKYCSKAYAVAFPDITVAERER
jgi:hypothetical protein